MDMQKIVAAAQDGDSEAWEQLAAWLLAMLHGYLKGRVPWHEADDLRQRCFLAVSERFCKFVDHGPGSFGRWVRKIADNLITDGRRNAAREVVNLQKLVNQPTESTRSLVTKMTMIEFQGLVGLYFSQLGEAQQEAILWEREGRDDDDLAKLRDVSVTTIKTRRHRGYRELVRLIQLARRTPLPRVSYTAPRSSSSSP